MQVSQVSAKLFVPFDVEDDSSLWPHKLLLRQHLHKQMHTRRNVSNIFRGSQSIMTKRTRTVSISKHCAVR